jgi:hypothetical protein
MKEKELRSNLEKYLERLDEIQKHSFAPLDKLIQNALDGIDLHIMVMKHKYHLQSKDLA